MSFLRGSVCRVSRDVRFGSEQADESKDVIDCYLSQEHDPQEEGEEGEESATNSHCFSDRVANANTYSCFVLPDEESQVNSAIFFPIRQKIAREIDVRFCQHASASIPVPPACCHPTLCFWG